MECQSFVPGIEVGKSVSTKLEKAVINSSLFGGKRDNLEILTTNGLNYLPTNVSASHVVAVKVAGFDKAIYSLDKTPNSPILFEEGNELVSTTKLSDSNNSREIFLLVKEVNNSFF